MEDRRSGAQEGRCGVRESEKPVCGSIHSYEKVKMDNRDVIDNGETAMFVRT